MKTRSDKEESKRDNENLSDVKIISKESDPTTGKITLKITQESIIKGSTIRKLLRLKGNTGHA
jgi:hypothetical protein